MRIIEVAPLAGRYPERYSVWLAKYLERRGHEVVLVTDRRWSDRSPFKGTFGVKGIDLPMFDAPLLRIPEELLKWADVIHLNVHHFPTTPQYLLSRFHRKVVVTFHGLYRSRHLYRILPTKMKVLFMAKLAYDHLIFLLGRRAGALTSACKSDVRIIERGTGSRVFHTPNMVDLEEMSAHRIEGGRNHIVFAGRPSRRKGIDDLVRIIRSLPHERFLVFGNPRDMGAKIALPENALPKWGASRRELIRALWTAKALVLPSYDECHPLIVLEALAAGTPVVSYDVGDVRECGTVFTCPVGDWGCIVHHLRSLHDGVKVRLKEDFLPENVVNRYERVFERVISRE